MIKAILTDLDGVIRLWNSETLFQLEEKRGVPRGTVFSVCFEKALLHQAITGQILDDRWRQITEERLAVRFPEINAAELVSGWNQTKSSIDEAVLACYREMYPQAKLVLVTNATSRLQSDLEVAQIAQSFDAIINSSEVGAAKPDKAIYDHALTSVGVKHHEAVFVDDSKTNVLAANEMGIRSHHFEGIDGLRSFLMQIK